MHISFVQSVTMDSWKNERFVAKMRAGGNAAFNEFLARQGVPAKVIKGPPGTTDPERVREKYHARACALYKDKMDALADGRSWDEPPCAPPPARSCQRIVLRVPSTRPASADSPPKNSARGLSAPGKLTALCSQAGAVPKPGPKRGGARVGTVKRRRRWCFRDGWRRWGVRRIR